MITLDNINEVLRLDPATGKLFWKVGGQHGRLSGQEAGGIDAQGYRRLRIGKWGVNIGVGGRRVACGYFDDIHSAAAAYSQAAKRYHGEFARP